MAESTSKHLIRETVYKNLRERILSQQYQFGQRINIDSLSHELEVSNNPIREALARLDKDGLVVMKPNVGSRVMEFTADSFKELSETLEVLILGGFQLCQRAGRIEELERAMEEKLAIQKEMLEHPTDRGDADFAKAAIDFDHCFVEISGNQRLISIFDGLMDLFLLASVYDYQHRDVDKRANIMEHQAILEAVRHRSYTEIQDLITSHYDKTILFPKDSQA